MEPPLGFLRTVEFCGQPGGLASGKHPARCELPGGVFVSTNEDIHRVRRYESTEGIRARGLRHLAWAV